MKVAKRIVDRKGSFQMSGSIEALPWPINVQGWCAAGTSGDGILFNIIIYLRKNDLSNHQPYYQRQSMALYAIFGIKTRTSNPNFFTNISYPNTNNSSSMTGVKFESNRKSVNCQVTTTLTRITSSISFFPAVLSIFSDLWKIKTKSLMTIPHIHNKLPLFSKGISKL